MRTNGDGHAPAVGKKHGVTSMVGVAAVPASDHGSWFKPLVGSAGNEVARATGPPNEGESDGGADTVQGPPYWEAAGSATLRMASQKAAGVPLHKRIIKFPITLSCERRWRRRFELLVAGMQLR